MKTVTRNDSINRPLPKERVRISVHRVFTLAELARIKRGFLPNGSDDRWIIHFSNNCLYMHRSWTGVYVYVAHFKQEHEEFVLYMVEANRNAAQYAETDHAYDGRLCIAIIEEILLSHEPIDANCEGCHAS